jgi:type II secretory pathway component GspD/PulD (secretin)
MSQCSALSIVRRVFSSPRDSCARAALVFVVTLALLAMVSRNALAQNLRLAQATMPADSDGAQGITFPPTADAKPSSDSPQTPPQSAEALPKPPQSVASGSVAPASVSNPKRNDASAGNDGDLASALARRGDLTLRNSSVDGALFTIGELWHINIVVGEVKGTVNGVFRDAPLREILDTILLSNGYSYRPVGESLVVSPLAQLGQINPFFKSATIPVQSADIDEIVEGAKLLSTPQGQIRAIKSARSIFVLDFPDRVQMIRDFVTSIDDATKAEQAGTGVRAFAPLEVGSFRTQYITAKAAEDALAPILSKEGRVSIMEKEDRLLVSDYAENLAMVEAALIRIDRPRPQVRITALIYDLSLEDIQQLGINWNSTLKLGPFDAAGKPATSLGIDSVTKVPFPAGGAGSTLTFMNLSKFVDIKGVVLALNNAKDSRLLSDPSVAVLENEEAIFQKVSEIPYQQLTQTSQGGNIGTTAFKEAGITLRVKPKISGDGVIRMEISPEFSRLTGFTPGDNQPIIDKRTATTTLYAANGQTIVIGGLRQRDDVGDFKGVPYLKDMRLVGNLFRARDTDVRESELVVFVSPEIITPADPVNHRDQMVIDTLGCRLNMVPEAEGCPPPPCGCGPPTAGAPILCQGPFIAARPTRLPAATAVASDLTPPSTYSVAATNAATNSLPTEKSSSPQIARAALPPSFPMLPPADAATAAVTPIAEQSQPQLLPAVQKATAAPMIAIRPLDLFDAPPRANIGLPSEDDSKIHIGGAAEIGYRH